MYVLVLHIAVAYILLSFYGVPLLIKQWLLQIAGHALPAAVSSVLC